MNPWFNGSVEEDFFPFSCAYECFVYEFGLVFPQLALGYAISCIATDEDGDIALEAFAH